MNTWSYTVDSSCAAAIFPSWEDGENKVILLVMYVTPDIPTD